MEIVVVGGSAAGQFAALLLARAGHAVVLLDRDDLSPAPDVEAAAAAAFRPTAPQIVQPHALLARCCLLLREHVPDVYRDLIAAGAVEFGLDASAPPGLTLERAPGDEVYTSVATRRSTLDLVLRRAVAREPGITCRWQVRVAGLLAVDGAPPRVRGVRTDEGDLDADLVVDASGRRTRVDSWLAQIGAGPTELVEAECGLCYRSRHYRLRPGASRPGHPGTRILLALEEFTSGWWNGDNDSAMIAVAPLVEDARFRTVDSPEVFDALVARIPAFQPWLEVFEPVGPVFVMAGLHNTWRRLTVEGRLRVSGLALVGDSRCTTNPTFGRGIALSLLGAADLARALQACDGRVSELTERLEQSAAEHIEPFFTDQARNDGMRLAMLRHSVFGTPAPAPAARPDSVTFAQLRAAMALDPDVFRAFWRVLGMLEFPESVYTDPAVVSRTRAALHGAADPPRVPQPDRAELDAVLGGAVRT